MSRILRYLAAILPCSIPLIIQAQPVTQLLDAWSAKHPVEKVYVQTDRDTYVPGENIWYKAYLLSDYAPDTISTSIYLELSNGKGALLNRKIFPVFYGTSSGQIELPDTISSGPYFIRAYTVTQLNQDTAFLWNRRVMVLGKKPEAYALPLNPVVTLRFFPEGGNFVAGLLNTVAFRAVDEKGMPVSVSGQVFNSKGAAVADFTTMHDGMGMFDLTPDAGETYYAMPEQFAGTRKFDLPVPVTNGLVLRVMPDPGGKYYDIMQHSSDPDICAAYLVGQMQHHVVYRQTISKQEDWITGVIPIKQLPSGIMQLTVFNAAGMPLAERLTFIDNKEYLLKATFRTDTLQFGSKSLNHLTLDLADSVSGSFSVSVTDPEYGTPQTRDQHIISTFLLTGDLKGYIHDPAFYFSSDADSVKNALDLLLMTQGWRRFTWSKLAEQAAAKPLYADGAFITLSGKINLRDTRKPLAGRELLVMVTSADSVQSQAQLMETAADGSFRMDSLIFYGPSRVLVSDIAGKKSKWIDVYPGPDSVTRTFPVSHFNGGGYPLQGPDPEEAGRLRFSGAYDDYLRAEGQTLKGVTVKGVRKTALQQLDEKYTSGLFSGLTHTTLDLVHTNEKIISRNIFDYIQSKIAGVRVVQRGININVYYRQTTSLTSISGIPMILYLDEVQTDGAMIATIPANQIAMVKVFSTFPGAEGNGANGVLAIYTKKPDDLTNVFSSSTDFYTVNGYSVKKEFYTPDYTGADSMKTLLPDSRLTLHWQPDVLVSSAEPVIPIRFFNNDKSHAFRVIVEGMSWDGRLLYFEKVITPPAAKAF